MSNKKKWIIVVAAILVVVAIGLGVGLGVGLSDKGDVNNEDEGGIWFKENTYKQDFEYKGIFIGGRCKILVLVDSLDELKALCDEYNNPAYREDDEMNYNNSKELCDKLREYDDTFFADKALIIYTDVTGSGGTKYSIKKIDTENEEIIVGVKVRIWQGPSADIITPWTFLIEVNKDDITETKEIKYIKEYYYEKED